MADGPFDPQILVSLDSETSEGKRAPIGRVLLVGEDPVMRELTSSVLRRAGHSVVAADRARVALRELDLDQQGFDLMVTDLVMTGMNGVELARRVHLSRPTLLVLFISGHPDELASHAAEIEAFRPEPYSAEALLGAVEALLGSR